MQEPIGDVTGIVNTESNGEDDADAGDDVDGDAPDVKEANKIDQGEEDGGNDEKAETEAAEQEKGDDGDGEQDETKVPPKLPPDDLINLPSDIGQRVAERARQS